MPYKYFMIKFNLLIIGLLLFSFSSFSQKGILSGTVNDLEKNPIQNVVISLLTQKDSILHRFTRSDIEGKFLVKNIKFGKYIVITSHNQFVDYVDEIEIKETQINLGTIGLINKSKFLREVIVKGGSIRIKGDTTSYRASDFKVDVNANVEDLLKKLPGFQVGKNGEIKAMGETVKKVLVDGEEFFGDDPGMAVKNLRADAVKTVQVFDKKSDQAAFTGIDDGKTEKTINLKLKDDKKKGNFGKIDAANGPLLDIEPRYNTNLLFSSFKGKRKISAFLLHGNTGQDGLDWQDNDKFGGGNDNFSMNMDDDGNVSYQWMGGNTDDEPQIDTQNGFITNTNAGLQYTNKWNDKQTLNLLPKFNNQIYINNNKKFTKTQIGESQLIENAITATNVTRKNFKLNASYDIKIDSMNTIKINTTTNFYATKGNAFTNGITVDQNGVLKNNSQRNIDTQFEKQSLMANVLYKHKFAKLRRTFSTNLSWNNLNNASNNFLKSDNESFISGISSNKTALNQNKIGEKSTQSTNLNIIYTEPLNKKWAMQIGYQIEYNSGKNNQLTYDFSLASNRFDLLNTGLSNRFQQTIVVNKPNFKLSYNSKKINYSFGSGFGFTAFDLIDQTINKDYKRNFTNIFPSATFTYKYKNNGNFRINYNGSTVQPTIDQLQPLRNNQDFFNQIIGNPDLKQAFVNSINLSRNNYNMLSETHLYQGVNFRTTTNLITYNRDIDSQNAKTTSRAINTNGNFSGNFYMGYGFKIKKFDLDCGVNPSINFDKSVISINNNLSDSKNINSNITVYFSKTVEKSYEFFINNEFSYNRNSTSLTNEIKSFNSNNFSISGSYYFNDNWKMTTNYDLYTRQKTADFQNSLNNQLWNARLQRTFKNDEFTAYLLVRDILNQNIGIDRFNVGNVVGEEQNDRLKRYAMIGFTWNFKNK